MDMFTLLQAETVLAKSTELAQKDPYGWMITVVSISIVFISLALLFILYYLIGRIVNRFSKEEQHQQETAATQEAVADDSEDPKPHDKESYIITICPKDSIRISSPAPMASQSKVESDAQQMENTYAERGTSGKDIIAPLPGVITAIKVKPGDSVKKGHTVAVLEAMKMENELLAETDGVVQEVKAEKGDSVLEGAVIITFE